MSRRIATAGLWRRRRGADRGFTLIELLIVTAILSMLSAVVIPNISKFSISGAISAAKAERNTLQASVDAVMADAGVSVIPSQTGWTGTTGVVTLTVGPTTYDAADYLQIEPTRGTFDVSAEGVVSCTDYPGLGAGDIAKINGS